MKIDIDKYIKNTEEKTKKSKLPALSTMTPILPDAGAGIATFNAMSEDIDEEDVDTISSEIINETKKFFIDKGYDEEDIEDVVHFDFRTFKDVFSIVITARITISSLRELSDTLYEIINKYDKDAYFDISANNSISVDLNMRRSLREQLKRLDRKGFDLYCENYEFEALYESTKTKLDANDRSKLQKFLQTTDDPEEVNTFMKGLLMEEADDEYDDGYDDYDMYDDFDDEPGLDEDDINDSNEIEYQLDELKKSLNSLTAKANKDGNDRLRSASDLALGALDDLSSYINDIFDLKEM